jgi:hypothetical protein
MPNYDNLRQSTLENDPGTTFGTARLAELALRTDDALLFRSVGPLHHGSDREPKIARFAGFSLHFSPLPHYLVRGAKVVATAVAGLVPARDCRGAVPF